MNHKAELINGQIMAISAEYQRLTKDLYQIGESHATTKSISDSIKLWGKNLVSLPKEYEGFRWLLEDHIMKLKNEIIEILRSDPQCSDIVHRRDEIDNKLSYY